MATTDQILYRNFGQQVARTVRGRTQREGGVAHLVARHLAGLSGKIVCVSQRDNAFLLPHGRGDELHHGSPTPDPHGMAKGPRPAT